MNIHTLTKPILCASVVVLLFGCRHPSQPDPVQQASEAFKTKIGFRTKEAEFLFPLVTNGMQRAEVERLLGRPKKYDGTWAAEADAVEWDYGVFYSQHLTVTFKDDRVASTTAIGFADRSKSSQ